MAICTILNPLIIREDQVDALKKILNEPSRRTYTPHNGRTATEEEVALFAEKFLKTLETKEK